MSVTIKVENQALQKGEYRKAFEKALQTIREFQPVDGFIIYMVKGGKAQLTGVAVDPSDITALIMRLIILFPELYNSAVMTIMEQAGVEGVNN